MSLFTVQSASVPLGPSGGPYKMVLYGFYSGAVKLTEKCQCHKCDETLAIFPDEYDDPWSVLMTHCDECDEWGFSDWYEPRGDGSVGLRYTPIGTRVPHDCDVHDLGYCRHGRPPEPACPFCERTRDVSGS